jgi:hypothetical protein
VRPRQATRPQTAFGEDPASSKVNTAPRRTPAGRFRAQIHAAVSTTRREPADSNARLVGAGAAETRSGANQADRVCANWLVIAIPARTRARSWTCLVLLQPANAPRPRCRTSSLGGRLVGWPFPRWSNADAGPNPGRVRPRARENPRRRRGSDYANRTNQLGGRPRYRRRRHLGHATARAYTGRPTTRATCSRNDYYSVHALTTFVPSGSGFSAGGPVTCPGVPAPREVGTGSNEILRLGHSSRRRRRC